MRTPFVDLECCILCEVCIDLAPHIFKMNDAGFIEAVVTDNYSADAANEALNNCPRNCISIE